MMNESAEFRRSEIGLGWNLALYALFAIVITFIQTFETWVPSTTVIPGRQAPITIRLPSIYFRITLRRADVYYLSTKSSICPNIIGRGETAREGECGEIIRAYEKTHHPMKWSRIGGYLAINLLVILLLTLFMKRFGTYRARLVRSYSTFLLLIFLFIVMAKIYLIVTPWPAYFIPIAVIPLLAVYFFGRRIALVFILATTFWVVSLLNFDVQAFGIFLAQSMGAYLVPEQKKRSAMLLRAGFSAGWAALAITVATTLLFSGNLKIYDDWSEHWDPRYSIWIASLGGGVIAGVIAWLLVQFVAQLLGELSRARLLDLQDLDQPLLKKLREEAPGTFEHSRSMANLAEAAAASIGADAQLARAGAYFHDIGKIMNPQYFIENQSGAPNPHDTLDPDVSADTIFRHVNDGVRILRTAQMPEAIVEFVYTHHGTGLLEYFWAKNMKLGNPDGFNESDFCHRGVPPFSKETGVLMLVDAVEASSRTVEKHEKREFEHLVQTLVFSKMLQSQLDGSGLSIEDLKKITTTLIDALVNIYHARVKYPWQTEDEISVTTTSSKRKADLGLQAEPKPQEPLPLVPNGSSIVITGSHQPPPSDHVPPSDGAPDALVKKPEEDH